MSLHGTWPDDFLTDEELKDFQKAKRMDMTRAAKVQEMNHKATVQAEVHENLSEIDFSLMLDAIEAHIEARPDINAEKLEATAQRLSRLAWVYERG